MTTTIRTYCRVAYNSKQPMKSWMTEELDDCKVDYNGGQATEELGNFHT